MERLATLRADERGIVDIYHQGTYAGAAIPRDAQGNLALRLVGHEPRHPENMRLEYESICIRISGGFDD